MNFELKLFFLNQNFTCTNGAALNHFSSLLILEGKIQYYSLSLSLSPPEKKMFHLYLLAKWFFFFYSIFISDSRPYQLSERKWLKRFGTHLTFPSQIFIPTKLWPTQVLIFIHFFAVEQHQRPIRILRGWSFPSN